MKFLLVLLVIGASTPSFAEKKPPKCEDNFHKVCGHSDIIGFIKQNPCNETTFPLCPGAANADECQELCGDKLILNIDNFATIANKAFRLTNFNKLIIKSESDICEPKLLKVTPLSFHNLGSVRHLELDCVAFKSTPNALKTLTSVDDLFLSRTEISKLPQSIFADLKNLIKLMLSEVKIEAITPSVFADVNEELQVLALVKNQLSAIQAKSFEKFSSLKDLHITDNPITELQPDTFFGLNELTVLRLPANNITIVKQLVFRGLPKLEHLDLAFNQIREVEEEAFYGTPIERLELNYNKLECLPAGAFRNMPNLKLLELNANRISTLSPHMFEGLENNNNLDLHLSYNCLRIIEPHSFKGLNLRTLNLTFNELTVLENNIFSGLRIQKWINLRHNDIDQIRGGVFRNLTLDGVVYLAKYAVSQIDHDDWSGSDSVKEIDMSGLKA